MVLKVFSNFVRSVAKKKKSLAIYVCNVMMTKNVCCFLLFHLRLLANKFLDLMKEQLRRVKYNQRLDSLSNAQPVDC